MSGRKMKKGGTIPFGVARSLDRDGDADIGMGITSAGNTVRATVEGMGSFWVFVIVFAVISAVGFSTAVWAAVYAKNNGGVPGPDGPKGDNGTCPDSCYSPNITIGTVTTTDPGTNATVNNSGNYTNPVLDFTLPAGATGGGGIGTYGSFYGLTAGTGNGAGTDYPSTIAVKTSAGTGRVPFPRDGPAKGMVRQDPSSFLLPILGIYEITFRVHTTEPGQLQLELNGVSDAATTAVNMNPTSGGHPIIGNFFVNCTSINSVLAVINPSGNTPALTVTSASGSSTNANAQSLTIKYLSS